MAEVNFNRNKKKNFKNLQRFRVKDLIKPANLKIIANFLSKFH